MFVRRLRQLYYSVHFWFNIDNQEVILYFVNTRVFFAIPPFLDISNSISNTIIGYLQNINKIASIVARRKIV